MGEASVPKRAATLLTCPQQQILATLSEIVPCFPGNLELKFQMCESDSATSLKLKLFKNKVWGGGGTLAISLGLE